MTFDPVLPPLALGAIALAVIAMRMLSLRLATRGRTGRWTVIRWAATTLAMLLVVLAAARPGTGAVADAEASTSPQAGANVYFVVDRSADSAIEDFDGSARMSAIRDDIDAVIQAHPGSRFALISFASRPAVDWPLSSDAWSLEPVIESLNPYPDPESAGSEQANAAAAANVLRYQLIAAGQQYPRSQNLVFYLGSGAGQSTVPQGEFETRGVDGGAVLGYDTGPGRGADTLRDVARQLGVPYVARGAGEALPQAEAADDAAASVGDAAQPDRVEWYWVLTLLASALLLAEIYLSARDLRRARATQREALR